MAEKQQIVVYPEEVVLHLIKFLREDHFAYNMMFGKMITEEGKWCSEKDILQAFKESTDLVENILPILGTNLENSTN